MNEWWQRRTLRFRLALWYAVGGTLLISAFSATLYLFVSQRMARPLDHELRRKLEEVRRRLVVGRTNEIFWDGVPVKGDATWRPDNPWIELWDEHGQLVRRLWPFSADRIESFPVFPSRRRETISVFSVAPDIRLRVLSVPFPVPGHSEPWMIRVMTTHEPVADALGALRLIIFLALPVVVLLLVIGGYIITRRWLRPLDRMVAEANRITAENLGHRLPMTNPHDELGHLAGVFNVTLDRLERSFVALDRFVADASHELRTPLTTLRSVGEVGLRRSRTVEEYREIIGSMLEEAQRLQLLVQRLLELATTEGGASPVQLTRIPLHDYVTACVGELNILADFRRQQISVETTPCDAIADPVFLRQAIQNLLDNATKYSPDGSKIHVTVGVNGTHCTVAVRDEGPGITPESQEHLAERFYRPDSGRGRSKGGFGLGLSITKAYMRVVGGKLSYEPAQPSGSIFRLTLPKA
jgi:heavy metal sensor kinase